MKQRILLAVFGVLIITAFSNRNANIYYFLDAECSQCSVDGHLNAAVLIMSDKIVSGDMAHKETAISSFRDKITQRYSTDSLLTESIVFRWDESESKLKASYAAREKKMKDRGYTILKISI